MTYKKPEIANLGDAASVIHGQPKAASQIFDTDSQLFNLVPAYELDE